MWTPPTSDETISQGGWSPPPTDETVGTPKKGLFGTIANGIKAVSSNYFNSPAVKTSPLSLLGSQAPKAANMLSNAAGEKVAEGLGKNMNPYVAAGAGTVVSMAPDVMMSVFPGEEASAVASEAQPLPMFKRMAQDSGTKALGYTKRFLGSEKNLNSARQTAQTLLDKGVITSFATPEKMAERAGNLADESGQKIGQYLQSLGNEGKFFSPQEAVQSIESLRPKYRGGLYDQVHNKIDRAVQTIAAHGDQPIPFDQANELKGVLQDAANFRSNKDATLLDRVIAGKFRQSLDDSLEKVSSASGYKDFQDAKKAYSAALQAEDPLYNRISSDLGNNKISITDLILAAPELASGNPISAVGMVGGKKILQKFGPQTSASIFNKLANSSKAISSEAPAVLPSLEEKIQPSDASVIKFPEKPLFSNPIKKASAVTAAVGLNQLLTKEKAREYLDKANGDKDLARKLARKDGWKWKPTSSTK